MPAFTVHKVIGSLPAILQADAIYIVRTGAGFSLYVTETTGTVAHSLNLPGGSGGEFSEENFLALLGEVAEARGSLSRLSNRLSVISNFASPNVGGYVVGQFYDQSLHSVASGTLASAADRLELYPFYTSEQVRVDQIGIAVSTASAGEARVLIYGCGPDSWPSELLHSFEVQNTGTVGYRSADVDFVFERGRQYWIGRHTSAAPTLRTVTIGSVGNLGLNGSNGTNYFTLLRRTVAYASGAPENWNFVNADRVTNTAQTSIRFRVAEVLTPIPAGNTLELNWNKSRSLVLALPEQGEREILFRTSRPFEVKQIDSVLKSSGSVNFSIRYGSDVSLSGTEVVTGGITCNSSSSGVRVSSFDSAEIPQDSYVWVTVGEVSGSPGSITITVDF